MKNVVEEVLAKPGFVFCEIFTNTTQVWEPKSSTKRLADGTLISPPLEDLAPFLPREELLQNMYIKPIGE
jgi:acetolactate synthase-1/2/3 large subunit